MTANAFDALTRLFHEPKRLAIMSALCGADRAMTFNELKAVCDLTDGNLSRHLTTLEKSRAVKIKKSFVGVKPRTTVSVTAEGRRRFIEYLDALEEVLRGAAEAVQGERDEGTVPRGRVVGAH